MQFGFKKRNGTKEEEMYWRNNGRGLSKMVEKNANITNIRHTENPGLNKTTNACTGSTPTPHIPIFIRIKLLLTKHEKNISKRMKGGRFHW